MAAAAFLGFVLISAGPILVIWCTFIARKSFLVLLALASAFYWLVTLLLIALLFRAFVPLPENAAVYALVMLLAVGIQEASRDCAYLMHRQIVRQLQVASQHMRLPAVTNSDKQLLALAQGMGHALAQNTFLYFSFVFLAAGQGTKYLDKCPQMSYFLASGLLSLAFFMLHSSSMVIAFYGYEAKKVPLVGAVGGLHLLASLTTLISLAQGGCVAAVCLTIVEGAVAAGAALHLCWRKSMQQGGYRIDVPQPSSPHP